MNDRFSIGVLMLTAGLIYFMFSIYLVKKHRDESTVTRKSILIKNVIISITLILGGLIYIFKYA